MCMCANLEGQYHDEAYRRLSACGDAAPTLSRVRGRGRGRGLAAAQHLCGALVGLVDPGLVGIGLREEAKA